MLILPPQMKYKGVSWRLREISYGQLIKIITNFIPKESCAGLG